jgi:hypothetical protein
MSLYEGPTILRSTAWHAIQFLERAKASSAITGAASTVPVARIKRAFFIMEFLLVGRQNVPLERILEATLRFKRGVYVLLQSIQSWRIEGAISSFCVHGAKPEA